MLELHVPDMSCGHCVATITKSVQALDPSAEVRTDLANHTVSIETTADAAKVRAALDEAGYPSTTR
jgi:copper chaperone